MWTSIFFDVSASKQDNNYTYYVFIIYKYIYMFIQYTRKYGERARTHTLVLAHDSDVWARVEYIIICMGDDLVPGSDN